MEKGTTDVWWIWGIVAALIALPVAINLVLKAIVVPIKIWRQPGLASQPQRVATTLDDLTPEIQELLAAAIRQFAAEGFVVVANVTEPQPIPSMRSIQVMLVNRPRVEVGLISTVWAVHLRMMAISVRTEFENGRRIVTGSARMAIVFPRDPRTDGVNFSWVRDARALCEAHRRRVQKAGPYLEQSVVPEPGDEIGYLDRERHREMERCVRAGWHYLDPTSQRIRWTLRGAFLGAWKMLEPFKSWRTRRRDRAARKLWRELQMDQWKPAEPDGTSVIAEGKQTDDDDLAREHTSLAYETSLATGELRVHQASRELVVRMGNPTLWQFLMKQVGNLVVTGMMLLCAGFFLLTWWLNRRLFAGSPYGYESPFASGRWFWFTGALVVLIGEIIGLTRGVCMLRGATVLRASHEGLRFHNAPDHPATGFHRALGAGDVDGRIAHRWVEAPDLPARGSHGQRQPGAADRAGQARSG
jgi:hypothetical protein